MKKASLKNAKYKKGQSVSLLERIRRRRLQRVTGVAAVVAVFGVLGLVLTTQSNAATTYTYPIKLGVNNRHMVDQNNKPFLYDADTAWMMLSTLSRSEAAAYMDARKAQGFNTIQTAMVNWERAYNKFGVTAFQNKDISKPNEAYFVTIDEIVQDAAARNMQLIMGPLWLNNSTNGSEDGLPTVAQWQAYGQYVGARYKNYDNIMWFMGGDHDPINTWGADNGFDYKPYIDAMANAIKAQDNRHLMTYHPAIDTHSLANRSWLDFYSLQRNLANSSPWSYMLIKPYTELTPTKPILNIEPAYETRDALSNTATSPYMVRRNAWWSQLAGAVGIAYGGSSNTWDISPGSWQNSVNLPGAVHSGMVRTILEPLPWEKLVPDWTHSAVTGGYGTYGNSDYVTAGLANDGSLLVAYTPNSRTLTVNMSKMAGEVRAYWYDPTNGNSTEAGTFANQDSRAFATPAQNAAGDKDFVLVLTASTQPPPPTPPTVQVTAPVSGATVRGQVMVAANATDTHGVVNVQFKLDGNNLGDPDVSAPYSVSWDSVVVDDGAHTLSAVATDTDGMTATAAAVPVTVQNAATPPTVQLTTPSNGATLSNTATVSASASDAQGVSSVQFKLDGNNLGAADTTAPYSVAWDTKTAANGSHTLTAVATNAIGLSATSSPVTANVQNTAATGLTGRYYRGTSLSGNPLLTRNDKPINFWWSGSPGSGVPSDNFSVRWTGQLKVPTTGTYMIAFYGDDGYRVKVDGKQVINNWRDQSPAYRSGNINLTGGRNYPITIEHYARNGTAVAQLFWSGPGISYQIIPANNLAP